MNNLSDDLKNRRYRLIVEWPKLREKLQKIEQNKDLKKIAATASTPWIAYWQDPNTSKWMIHPIDTPKEACQIVKALFKKYNELINVGTVAKDKWKEHNYWNMNTQFCGVCGAPMKMATDISKKCTECGKQVWPSLATAIIVLIKKDDQVLLVHARNFKGNFDSLVAGFVETGENLEEAVHREVMEETGLTIKNLKYFGSQPWPYPSGLMIGFSAEYVDGEIHLQKEELSRGKWFTKENLPILPEKLSIARKLIDAWLADKL
jgi:NAD+ diphosphatase